MNGALFRGSKPVMWSVVEKTALAEAEVEYQDYTSDTVWVKFPVRFAVRDGAQTSDLLDTSVVIWTTTPWTIPANQALNVHPDVAYALVKTPRGHLVLANDLVASCLARYGITGAVVASAPGAALERVAFRHPFYDRAAPIYLGGFVTLEQGTGIVHSSPAYGIDDFLSSRRYGMTDDEILNPVQGNGRYAESLPLFGGLSIWDANPRIVEKLREANALLHSEKFPHSYMHCWRH
jgi:isoleucyl-tRNA synthetase